MAKLCEHGYFLDVAPRSCPKCRTDLDLIQREEISTLKATISRLRAELAEWRKDAERYRHLLSEAYVFGRTTPDIHNIPDEPVSLWLHSTVPLDVEGINRLVDTARKGEEDS